MSKALQSIDDFVIELGSGNDQLTLNWGDYDDDTVTITGTGAQPTYNIDVSNASSTSMQGIYNNFPTTGINTSPGQTLQWGTGTSPGLSYNWNDTITIGDINTNQGTLKVNGDAEFDGDIKLQGKSLSETLSKLEERLAILHPNPELEEKWEELKSLGTRYKELEKEIIEKEKMWNILKK